ncbi:MAG: Gfo/Idh/MocA family oxidoreductase [Ruminococcaceae bacterium]|nr:Gfo/Idh/MocA family oxidoreductase [Oscillospiraceae bacterium]
MKLRWGFIGAGRIIHRFMTGITAYEDASVSVVYARNLQKGLDAVKNYSVGRVTDSLDDFLSCGEVDVAYIATTHPTHLQFAKACLNAGIPVLCEKPMTPNAIQTRELVECARKNNVFLMEAMWTRFFPVNRKIKSLIEAGAIGKPLMMTADFAFRGTGDPSDRLYKPEDAGGSVLDVGVYPLAYANMMFGSLPAEFTALGTLCESGVDESASFILKYPGGELATLFSSIALNSRQDAVIYGSEGRIEVDSQFWRARSATLIRNDRTEPITSLHFPGEGYQFEIEHVHECLANSLTESPLMTLDESIALAELCDSLRTQLGVKYPFE